MSKRGFFRRLFSRRRWLSDVLAEVAAADSGRGAGESGAVRAEECFERAEGGLIVPVKDPGAFAEAVLWLMGQPALRAEMGRRNRQVVERHFSWDQSAERLLAVYEDVASGCGN